MSDYRNLDNQQEQFFNEKNIAEFRANGGKVGGAFEGFPLLLLTTTGAKSGEERVNPVGYFEIDGKIYIVGSAAGRDKNPGWVANVRKDPNVFVEIGDAAKTEAVTVELPRGERDRIFEIIVRRAPGFGDYQKATERVIPIFEIRTA